MVVIYNYINEHLFAPDAAWSEHEFERRSYARWAACEIMDRVMRSEESEPFFIILYFMYQVDKLSELREDSDAEFIFKIARETAEEILELF